MSDTKAAAPADDFDSIFEGIGCASVEDVEIPSGKSGFFSPPDGVTKLRFLQGPVLSFISQEWKDKKPVGEKKKYAYKDPEAKKDPNAKLVMTFLIFDYTDQMVKIWEIKSKEILEDIKNINGIQPDLSAFDVQITKSVKANGFNEYKIAQGPNKPFVNEEAINEVKERGLIKRLADIANSGEEAPEEEAEMAKQVAAAAGATTATEAAEVFK